jgi:branched-chain amino acid transport system substrate-binding protein
MTCIHRLLRAASAAAAGLLGLAGATLAPAAQAQEIKIGFGMSLTGPLAVNGKQALLGMKIWEEEVNAKGGLLGRKVKLVFYDDQSNPSTVPGIYTKLIDVDKVELVIGGYATNQVVPAIPVAAQKKKTLIGLFAADANHKFKYPGYFSVIPVGQDTGSFTGGFFAVAAEQSPKPQTLAIAMADAEFAHNICGGARENAKKAGLRIVYDKSYPPATQDFTPIVRAVQAANPDLFLVCSYPVDSVGMVRAVREVDFKPKMFGGAMVGLQATGIKNQLKEKLNGIVNYETWVPSMVFEGTNEFFKKYQARANAEGVDALGYYLGGWGYAYIQVLGQAVEGAKSIEDDKIADFLRKNEFKTIHGNIKFAPNGEWAEPGMLAVQYRGITPAADVETWRTMEHQTVVWPAKLKTGSAVYPYEKAR